MSVQSVHAEYDMQAFSGKIERSRKCRKRIDAVNVRIPRIVPKYLKKKLEWRISCGIFVC